MMNLDAVPEHHDDDLIRENERLRHEVASFKRCWDADAAELDSLRAQVSQLQPSGEPRDAAMFDELTAEVTALRTQTVPKSHRIEISISDYDSVVDALEDAKVTIEALEVDNERLRSQLDEVWHKRLTDEFGEIS